MKPLPSTEFSEWKLDELSVFQQLVTSHGFSEFLKYLKQVKEKIEHDHFRLTMVSPDVDQFLHGNAVGKYELITELEQLAEKVRYGIENQIELDKKK